MIHRPWPTDALLAMMADGNLPQHPIVHPPRSTGRHMSDLYHALYPQKANDFTEKDLKHYQVIGLAMEDRMERALVELALRAGHAAERPGEIVGPGGIVGSPDVLFVEGDGILRVGELKAPYKSCRGLILDREGENEFPDRFDIYFCQIMAYCYVLGTRFGRLIVYFICGDWKPCKPVLHAWDLEFSQIEIDENFDALMQEAFELWG